MRLLSRNGSDGAVSNGVSGGIAVMLRKGVTKRNCIFLRGRVKGGRNWSGSRLLEKAVVLFAALPAAMRAAGRV